MFTNKILERISRGEKALGLSMSDPSVELVELAGRMGLDFVGFDGQHSPITPERVEQLCTVADGFGITPTMRIPDGQESTILSYLDRGIRQITVPNLQTKEEAEALVKYVYFAPLGLRSATSIRMVFNQEGGDRTKLFEDVNANTMITPQLESYTSYENLDEILTVDGIGGFGGGKEDMAQSLGLPGQHASQEVEDVYVKIKEKVRASGKIWVEDSIETVAVFGSIMEDCQELLEKHGRKSELGW